MLIDTHAHLNFAAYKDDIEEVIKRTKTEDTKVINVGSQYSTSQRAVEMAEKHASHFYAAVGLHPIHLFDMHVDESEVGFKTRKEEFSTESYKKLASSPQVVAIGEMGIDYFHRPDEVPIREFERIQKWNFLKGINLAKELGLPLILHCRGSKENETKAYIDMLGVLKEGKYNKGVVHCYTADWETAKKFLDAGFMISFTGIITFPKTAKLAEVVRKTPIDRIMIETDSPYLAPQIVRGKRNEPRYVRYVASRVAEIKGLDYDEVEEKTFSNAEKFFKLK